MYSRIGTHTSAVFDHNVTNWSLGKQTANKEAK